MSNYIKDKRDIYCRDHGHDWEKKDKVYQCAYCEKKINFYTAHMIGADKYVRELKNKK